MGAWGVEAFQNDSALDWTFELEGVKDLKVLEHAFSAVTESAEYLDSDDCCSALAAAEVVTALLKKPPAYLPKEVEDFLAGVEMQPSPGLVMLAKQAVQKVKSDSELKELWDESEEADGWHRSVDALLARLN
jgi:hypothetical protein